MKTNISLSKPEGSSYWQICEVEVERLFLDLTICDKEVLVLVRFRLGTIVEKAHGKLSFPRFRQKLAWKFGIIFSCCRQLPLRFCTLLISSTWKLQKVPGISVFSKKLACFFWMQYRGKFSRNLFFNECQFEASEKCLNWWCWKHHVFGICFTKRLFSKQKWLRITTSPKN